MTMGEKLLSLVLLLSIFAIGYFYGYRNGCKYAYEKVVKYLKSKMTDEKAARIFTEIIKTK